MTRPPIVDESPVPTDRTIEAGPASADQMSTRVACSRRAESASTLADRRAVIFLLLRDAHQGSRGGIDIRDLDDGGDPPE